MAFYHPLFLYELIWDVLNAGLLIWASKRFRNVLRRGDLFLIYLMFYSFGRFFLEFLRLDPSPVAGIDINQTLMAVTFVVSTLIFILRRRFIASEPLAVPAETPAEKAQDDDDAQAEMTPQ